MKRLIIILLLFFLPLYLQAQKKDSYLFVMIPKVVHPWFELVYEGAKNSAAILEEQTGSKFIIEYYPPKKADIDEQNLLIQKAINKKVDGIMIDLLSTKRNIPLLYKAKQNGIQVVIFDSLSPDGVNFTSVGNDFCEQAKLAAHRLAAIIDQKGEVAIMKGVPTAPNHMERAKCHEETFKLYPNIKVVDRGFDYDNIERSKQEAIKIMKKHPNLKGWVSCDAAGPIGIGEAILELGKKENIKSVGTGDLPKMIEFIKEGIADSSTSTKPKMQGHWSVIMLWQATLGVNMPRNIDTGIAIITNRMTDNYKGF